MAKRIKKQTVEEISEVSPVFDKDRFEDDGGYVSEENKDWFAPEEIWGKAEEDTQEVISVFLPVEPTLQVTTKPHASVFNSASKVDRALNIHLSLPEDFVVYARLIKDKHSLTRYYRIAEGPLNNLMLDKDEILSIIPID